MVVLAATTPITLDSHKAEQNLPNKKRAAKEKKKGTKGCMLQQVPEEGKTQQLEHSCALEWCTNDVTCFLRLNTSLLELQQSSCWVLYNSLRI